MADPAYERVLNTELDRLLKIADQHDEAVKAWFDEHAGEIVALQAASAAVISAANDVRREANGVIYALQELHHPPFRHGKPVSGVREWTYDDALAAAIDRNGS